jgi:hypothetical protein
MERTRFSDAKSIGKNLQATINAHPATRILEGMVLKPNMIVLSNRQATTVQEVAR